MSASNPSRIPFEMMAAGLPVVDLYRENNLYDMPEQGVLLSQSTPESIAETVIRLVKDDKLRKKMSDYGTNYMSHRPLERGYQQFVEITDAIISNDDTLQVNYGKSYKTKLDMKQTEYISEGLKTVDVRRKMANIRKMLLRIIRFAQKCNRKIHFLYTKLLAK